MFYFLLGFLYSILLGRFFTYLLEKKKKNIEKNKN